MITTITLNPAIDRTIVVDHFTPGAVNRISQVREDMGGKGINVARILKSLGSDVKAVAFLGQDNLAQAEALLQRDDLDVDPVLVPAATRTNTKMIDEHTKTTTDLNEPGFIVTGEQWLTMVEKVRACSQSSRYIVMSGSAPGGLAPGAYRELIQACDAACQVILDASGQLLLEGLAAGPLMIKPNIHELSEALDRQLSSKETIITAASELIRDDRPGIVLVSMGGDGSILVTGDAVFYAAPVPVNVQGTVGAGDSMLAGFVHALDNGLPPEQCLAWATACGSLAVSKIGTEPFTYDEALAMTQKVVVERIK